MKVLTVVLMIIVAKCASPVSTCRTHVNNNQDHGNNIVNSLKIYDILRADKKDTLGSLELKTGAQRLLELVLTAVLDEIIDSLADPYVIIPAASDVADLGTKLNVQISITNISVSGLSKTTSTVSDITNGLGVMLTFPSLVVNLGNVTVITNIMGVPVDLRLSGTAALNGVGTTVGLDVSTLLSSLVTNVKANVTLGTITPNITGKLAGVDISPAINSFINTYIVSVLTNLKSAINTAVGEAILKALQSLI